MSPLLPKGRRGWEDDPGHIHDSPEPDDQALKDESGLGPEEQERVGLNIPAIDSITTRQASEEAREPDGEPVGVPELSEVDVPRPLAAEIRKAMKRYPQKRSASIPALWAVQRRYGWCSPEGIEQAAAVMGLTPAYLESVATFYDLFHTEPRGKHEVLVCTNISCWLRGADELLEAFMDAAREEEDPHAPPVTGTHGSEVERTPEVTVRSFECLGACDIAPMASIDERYYGPLTDADAATALEQMRTRKEVLPEKRLADRDAAGGSGPRIGTDPRVTRHSLNKVRAKKAAARKAAGGRAAPKRKAAARPQAAAKRKPAAGRKTMAKKKPAAKRRTR
jgi:NADH-quinone oxidoreductase subunit E